MNKISRCNASDTCIEMQCMSDGAADADNTVVIRQRSQLVSDSISLIAFAYSTIRADVFRLPSLHFAAEYVAICCVYI